jgi:hypothetical protein
MYSLQKKIWLDKTAGLYDVSSNTASMREIG